LRERHAADAFGFVQRVSGANQVWVALFDGIPELDARVLGIEISMIVAEPEADSGR